LEATVETNPTPTPRQPAQPLVALHVTPDQASEVNGGKGKSKLSDYAAKGKTVKEVVT
jgi:hypothetical protein